MNRNQRIVVSIVGIIIVTLALIGITYAYFMARIIGNSTSKSISGTLTNLELTYSDGNGLIATSEMMLGDTLEKTFSVQNTGSAKVDNYAVILEDTNNTLTRKEDLIYTLTCSSDSSDSCKNQDSELNFPSGDGILVINSIKPKETHNYTLKITYKNHDDINQSIDMGKTFSAKVNITELKQYNPYAKNSRGLAYKIANEYASSEFIVKQNVDMDYPLRSSGDLLSIANDSLGYSYYFTGNVDNNYINFANMCWRIVRVQGDGSIKIVLEDKEHTCDSSSKGYSVLPHSSLSNAPSQLQSWYNSKLKSFESKLKLEDWPYEDTFSYSVRYASLKTEVDDKTISSYIGLLTGDEVLFAGIASPERSGYYVTDFTNCYLTIPNLSWLTLSKDKGFTWGYLGVIYHEHFGGSIMRTCNPDLPLRPVVVLMSNISVTGTGTKSNPYVVQ